MKIEVTLAMIVSHFLVGLALVIYLVSVQYRNNGKLKSDSESWSGRIFLLLIAFISGYIGLSIIIIVLIIHAIINIIKKQLKKIKWINSADFYTYLIVLFVSFAILTECTAQKEGATCRDGTYSSATGQGACSWHGGVSSWDKDY